MGKGDIKTKKGKRHIGSYGKHRPRKTAPVAVKKADKDKKADAAS